MARNENIDATLTIKEMLDAHSALPTHNDACEKRCLLEVLQSLDKPMSKRIVVKPNTIHKIQ
jgi:hypothetical protein